MSNADTSRSLCQNLGLERRPVEITAFTCFRGV
jgi:hypothetical protein